MKIYLVGVFLLLLTGCTPQPQTASLLPDATCDFSSKVMTPYSLEFLSQEYECSKNEKVNG